MTKLLYIPNGVYLRFYSDNFASDRLEDSLFNIPNACYHTPEEIIQHILENAGSVDWLELHGLEATHVFSREELEVIYD